MPPIEERTLRAMLGRYADAVRECNLTAFLALYSDDVVIFDAWDRWSYRCKPEWAEAVAIWFGASAAEALDVDFEETTCDSSEAVRPYMAPSSSNPLIAAAAPSVR